MNARNFPPSLLLVLLLAAMLAPALALAQPTARWPDTGDDTNVSVVGKNDPEQDYETLKRALEEAEPGDTLNLEGVFDITRCGDPLIVDKNLTISGPSDPNEAPSEAVQIKGCGPAFKVQMTDESEGSLTIQNLYFRDQSRLSIQLANSGPGFQTRPKPRPFMKSWNSLDFQTLSKA